MPKAAFSMRLQGDKQLNKALRDLGKMSRQRKVLRRALNFATTPVNRAAKQRVPQQTGTLKKSLGKVTRTYNEDGAVLVVIGPREGHSYTDDEGQVHRPTKYAHLVEFGTRHSQAKPFLRPAYDANVQIMQARFTDKAWETIRKEAARVAAKGG